MITLPVKTIYSVPMFSFDHLGHTGKMLGDQVKLIPKQNIEKQTIVSFILLKAGLHIKAVVIGTYDTERYLKYQHVFPEKIHKGFR